MKLTTEQKLSAMTANRNALREEIKGLQLYLNSLLAELGRPPKFQIDDVPCNHPGCAQHVTHPCEQCGRKWGDNEPE